MVEEMEAITTNKTWTLVPKDPSMNIFCSKWNKIKKNSNGSIKSCKARLVAHDYDQEE